jgi:hypothetical protein
MGWPTALRGLTPSLLADPPAPVVLAREGVSPAAKTALKSSNPSTAALRSNASCLC